MKIISVIGARPQFIKAAPVSSALAATGRIEEILVHTGQHYDYSMSDVFFAELGLRKPSYNLGIGGGSHGENTGRMIEGIERVLMNEKPDWVLVYGDTDSTLAGAIAGAKLHLPIAHVEAGLRSHNMRMPEEINRRLTDHCSSLLFTPTAQADGNLVAEGVDCARIVRVGDVMYDACMMFGRGERCVEILANHGLERQGYVLATVHRQENTDSPERMSAILVSLGGVASPVILPLHPRTKQRMSGLGICLPPNVIAIEPQGYSAMNDLMRNASYIVTDSGGVQKEAYFHRVPCITLRDETEWTELVDMGWNRLVSPSAQDLAQIVATKPGPGRDEISPYGDGTAAAKIAAALIERALCA